MQGLTKTVLAALALAVPLCAAAAPAWFNRTFVEAGGYVPIADKVYAGFTSSQTLHGGQETTLLALYNTIHHFGGLIVSPGYTDGSKFVDGNPYGVSHVTGANNDAPVDETVTTALDHLVTRAITISEKLNA